MHVVVVDDQGQKTEVGLNDEAKQAVRLSFNPSGNTAVLTLKVLAAAFLTYCDYLKDGTAGGRGPGARELAVAKTHMETAQMWAVKGATAGV